MAGHERETEDRAGWGRSDKFTITIASGDKGAGSGNIDLGRNYAYLIIRCTSCANIPAATTLALTGALDENETMCSIYELANNTLTLLAPTLPTSGSMQFLCTPAFGVQYLHLQLSQNVTGTTVFEVYGIAESVAG